MYAVIELAGKQFSVEKGSRISCEKIEGEPNSAIAVDRVLLIKDGEKVQVGTPYLKGVSVKAKLVGHGRGKKIIGLKYKNKINYRRHYGHRQAFTSVLIEDIKA